MATSYRATFPNRGTWWVGWSEEVPGALTEGRTLIDAKSNLRDAIRLMLAPADLRGLPAGKFAQDRIRV